MVTTSFGSFFLFDKNLKNKERILHYIQSYINTFFGYRVNLKDKILK